jgi:hypothetical protein
MRVFAYCCAEFARITRAAAGVPPLLSPPACAASLKPATLSGYDFYYFDLHGDPGEDYWYTVVDGWYRVRALLASQVEEADLSGAVVFAASCYLGDEHSPMLEALLAAGAAFVIGGEGKNYSEGATLYGAPLLGLWLRRLVGWGIAPLKALSLAKGRLRLGRSGTTKADTLKFHAYCRRRV